MSTLPAWKFGCIPADSVSISSLLRTQLSSSLPMPMMSRKADTQAPLELQFELDLDDAAFTVWQQWVLYDLADGVLPFTIYIPWGTQQPRVRARLAGNWQARHLDVMRWQVSGSMEIERESLPRFSGGALTYGGLPSA